MASNDEVEDLLAETSLVNTSHSSPLRRKSILPQHVQLTVLVENNDKAERFARRQEKCLSNTPPVVSIGNDRRNSLGLGFIAQLPGPQIIEHISQCLTLNAENKINAKNAFSLQVIDFLTFMVKKQDQDMSNLQVASMSLDVSSKIYGYRVDSVHTDMLKIIMREKDEKIPDDDADNSLLKCAENLDEDQAKKKKKKKPKLFVTKDSLEGKIESIKPSYIMIECSDSQTTDELCQVTLPYHANSGCYAHPFNDVIVDEIENGKMLNNKTVEIIIPSAKGISDAHICPPLFNFEFLNWTDEEEVDEDVAEPNENNESGFQFNLDASVPSDNEPRQNQYNFDINNEEDIDNLERCANDIPDRVENITDFLAVAKASNMTKMPEYSFLQKNRNIHWAGPPLWKNNNFRNILGNSKIMEMCHQRPAKKKKEIEVLYTDEILEAALLKFGTSQSIKMTEKIKSQWVKENFTLPRDMHYDVTCATKLYFHHTMRVQRGDENDLHTSRVDDGLENYNYNNEHDTSNYCPDIPNEDYADIEENNENEYEAHIYLGDGLVTAPKLANKLQVAYSSRAKKIDMRQLKESIWKCLVMKNEEENLKNNQEAVEQEPVERIKESKTFSEIHKALPDFLTENNADSLSFPISFVSLLHLANEKTLTLHSLPDMSDIIVEGT